MDLFSPFAFLAQWLTFSVFHIEHDSAFGSCVEFFIYDTLKIFLLIIVITHIMSVLRYYFPTERIRDFLTKRTFYGLDYFFASMFGAVTPFCSCSSVPLFIGFLEARIPLGVTFAFMITSPLINEVAIALFLTAFGWKVTVAYICAGMFIGVFGGFFIGKLQLEEYVADFVWNIRAKNSQQQALQRKSFFANISNISRDAFAIVKKIALYVFIGVGIGAAIHGFVPDGFFEQYLKHAGLWSVPLATIVAVPLYGNASSVIPIIQSLIAKGMPLGTMLAFMMAVVGLSLPEAMILKKVLRWQLLATFFGVVTIGIIIIGYVFNWIFLFFGL